jgi:hypothetical protein
LKILTLQNSWKYTLLRTEGVFTTHLQFMHASITSIFMFFNTKKIWSCLTESQEYGSRKAQRMTGHFQYTSIFWILWGVYRSFLDLSFLWYAFFLRCSDMHSSSLIMWKKNSLVGIKIIIQPCMGPRVSCRLLMWLDIMHYFREKYNVLFDCTLFIVWRHWVFF